MVLSLWAMTILSLYIRVQVNILGRHLYIDTARGFGSSLIIVRANYFSLFTYAKIFTLQFVIIVGFDGIMFLFQQQYQSGFSQLTYSGAAETFLLSIHAPETFLFIF